MGGLLGGGGGQRVCCPPPSNYWGGGGAWPPPPPPPSVFLRLWCYVKICLICQRIHMKNQALFSSKDKSKNLKCRLLQFLSGALRVRAIFQHHKRNWNVKISFSTTYLLNESMNSYQTTIAGETLVSKRAELIIFLWPWLIAKVNRGLQKLKFIFLRHLSLKPDHHSNGNDIQSIINLRHIILLIALTIFITYGNLESCFKVTGGFVLQIEIYPDPVHVLFFLKYVQV